MLDAEVVKKINQNSRKLVNGDRDYSFLDLAEHKIYRKAAKRKNSHCQYAVTFIRTENFGSEEIEEGLQKLSDAGYGAKREVVDEEKTGYVKVKW